MPTSRACAASARARPPARRTDRWKKPYAHLAPSGRSNIARGGARRLSREALAQKLPVEAGYYPAAHDRERPLDEIGLAFHQLNRLLRGKTLSRESHRPERRTFGIEKVARVAALEQLAKLSPVERVLRVVALVEIGL